VHYRYLSLLLLLAFASQSKATETVVQKLNLSDGSTFITKYTYLTPDEAVKAVADGAIKQLPKEGRMKTAYEAELWDAHGKLLAKRRYDHKPPKPDHGTSSHDYECVHGETKNGIVYMMLRENYGYSDSYCFQVHSFDSGVLGAPCVHTQIFMERASSGPSCSKIELLSYDVRGNIEVLIHPRVGENVTPYRKKFGPSGDASDKRIR
jgi:hypothetical protein